MMLYLSRFEIAEIYLRKCTVLINTIDESAWAEVWNKWFGRMAKLAAAQVDLIQKLA